MVPKHRKVSILSDNPEKAFQLLSFRVTPSEIELVKELAGKETISDFIRSLIYNDKKQKMSENNSKTPNSPKKSSQIKGE